MLKNFFLIALRNLKRHKLHAAINVVGLTIGITACMTLFQIVAYETQFDTFHPHKDRIYRIYTRFTGAFDGFNPGVPTGVYEAARDQLAGIEALSPIYTLYNPLIEIPMEGKAPRVFLEESSVGLFAPAYFDLFPYSWVAGSPEESLADPFHVVLTPDRVSKYFGLSDPKDALGKQIKYGDSLWVTVTGIVQPQEKPTDLYFTDFISFSTLEASSLKNDRPMNNWDNTSSSFQVFVRTTPGVDPARVGTQIDEIAEANREKNEFTDGWIVHYFLQPLEDLHFNQDLNIFDQGRQPAHLPTLYALLGISFILLLMGSINFVNLATAQALQRGKEVGVRKVLGGTRKALMGQFLSETLVVAVLAVALSVGLTELCITWFDEFMPAGLHFDLGQLSTIAFILVAPVVISLLAGAYPAFVLSGFKPVWALKNQVGPGDGSKRNAWLRKVLIVIQFTVSIVLILSTLIIGRQINFMLNKDLGFNHDAIIYFFTPFQAPQEKQKVLTEELMRLPEVEKISTHQRPAASNGYNTSTLKIQLPEKTIQKSIPIHRNNIDAHFLDLFEIQLVSGRELLPSDTLREFLANEAFVREMGLPNPEAALGITVSNGEGEYPIVGVVKDYHQQPLRQKIEPLLISQGGAQRCISLKLKTTGMAAASLEPFLAKMETLYKDLYPRAVFSYQFFDDTIARFYQEERRLAKLTQTAMAIAIFISCIGLFGLISLAVVQRTKEIGIRKVLGATVASIVALLSRDFLILVLVAFFMAAPIAWYFMHDWLEKFAYSLPVSGWIFLLAGMTALGIAFLTVGIQSMRAALANPVESLRSE